MTDNDTRANTIASGGNYRHHSYTSPPAEVYLRDVGGYAGDGQWEECWVVCAKGDPGAVKFVPGWVALAAALQAPLPNSGEREG